MATLITCKCSWSLSLVLFELHYLHSRSTCVCVYSYIHVSCIWDAQDILKVPELQGNFKCIALFIMLWHRKGVTRMKIITNPVCLSHPISPKGSTTEKIGKSRGIPYGETKIGKLLILLLYGGVHIQVNLYLHCFLHMEGIDNNGIVSWMGWQQQQNHDDSDLPGTTP